MKTKITMAGNHLYRILNFRNPKLFGYGITTFKNLEGRIMSVTTIMRTWYIDKYLIYDKILKRIECLKHKTQKCKSFPSLAPLARNHL